MTTPVGSGAVDNTPDTGGSVSYSGSGYGGADREDAPDVNQGRVHVPGEAPTTVVLDGPATMPVRKVKNKTKKADQRKTDKK
jgi:hypothetical protein